MSYKPKKSVKGLAKDGLEKNDKQSLQGQQHWTKKDSWKKNRWKYARSNNWTNSAIWFWNDASITCSGLIIIANIDNNDIYRKKHVIEILEKSGLGRDRINQKSIKICTWRAYVQLWNPKDVTKLERFTTVRFPDNENGKLVYIVHTPKRAFMRSGNWPLDMLFVIHHDKLETEYHEILDYSKTLSGDVYFAIAAMVKLSDYKTVVVLYRRSQLFESLTDVKHLGGVKEITSPSNEDLSELTAILNDNNNNPKNGWKFIQNPARKTWSKTENWKKRWPKYNTQRIRSSWSSPQALPRPNHLPWFGNHHHQFPPPIYGIMNPIPYFTVAEPKKVVRHVLTPLRTPIPLKPKVKKPSPPRQSQKINWNMLIEAICPKKPSTKASNSLTARNKKKAKAGLTEAKESPSSYSQKSAKKRKKKSVKQVNVGSRLGKKVSNVSGKDMRSIGELNEQKDQENTDILKSALLSEHGKFVKVSGDHKSDSDA